MPKNTEAIKEKKIKEKKEEELDPNLDYTLTHVIIILDESGSMSTIKGDTTASLKTFITEQKNLPGNCYLTYNTFSTKMKKEIINMNIKEVETTIVDNYSPCGGTAMNDAICFSLVDAVKTLRIMKENSKKVPANVVVAIITDGEENSSRYYGLKDVRQMIHRLKMKDSDCKEAENKLEEEKKMEQKIESINENEPSELLKPQKIISNNIDVPKLLDDTDVEKSENKEYSNSSNFTDIKDYNIKARNLSFSSSSSVNSSTSNSMVYSINLDSEEYEQQDTDTEEIIKNYGASFDFIYLGANIDSSTEGENRGFDQKYTSNWKADAIGIQNAHKQISYAVCSKRVRGMQKAKKLDQISDSEMSKQFNCSFIGRDLSSDMDASELSDERMYIAEAENNRCRF